MSRREFLRDVRARRQRPAAQPESRASPVAADPPKKGGTLRVGFYIEAATMDPHLSGSKIDRQVYHNIYEPLVALDDKLGIQPGLAESWSSPTRRRSSSSCAQGVKFHDGTDFNAEAAKFNFERMKNRAEVGPQGRGRQHRHGRGRRPVHGQAQPQAAGRGAAGHADRPRRA